MSRSDVEKGFMHALEMPGYTYAGDDAPRNPECDACKAKLPLFKNSETGELVHLDFFATPEAGSLYPCPVREKQEEQDA